MTWVLKVILFICIVPSTLLLFFLGFPKNPGKKKMIFGVRDNPRFHAAGVEQKVTEIVRSCRKAAMILTITICLLAVLLLFLPSTGVMMLAWVILVFAAIFLIAVPFAKGNKEMKALKKEIGMKRSGTVYTDLTSTNVVHGLKKPWLLLPNAIALAGTVFAILVDLGVIKVAEKLACEKNALTSMSLSFLFIAVILVPLAIMMDNARNSVISRDSNINANYNRAKKKGWADLFIAMSWTNALFLIAYTLFCMFVYSDTVLLVGLLVYMVILMAVVVIGVRNQSKIETRYARDTETELQDDDDNWVLGMFYYNPNDTRLNVEKRFGYGGTVNIAHPAGKAIMIIAGLVVIGTIVCLVWAAATGNLDSNAIHLP